MGKKADKKIGKIKEGGGGGSKRRRKLQLILPDLLIFLFYPLYLRRPAPAVVGRRLLAPLLFAESRH